MAAARTHLLHVVVPRALDRVHEGAAEGWPGALNPLDRGGDAVPVLGTERLVPPLGLGGELNLPAWRWRRGHIRLHFRPAVRPDAVPSSPAGAPAPGASPTRQPARDQRAHATYWRPAAPQRCAPTSHPRPQPPGGSSWSASRTPRRRWTRPDRRRRQALDDLVEELHQHRSGPQNLLEEVANVVTGSRGSHAIREPPEAGNTPPARGELVCRPDQAGNTCTAAGPDTPPRTVAAPCPSGESDRDRNTEACRRPSFVLRRRPPLQL